MRKSSKIHYTYTHLVVVDLGGVVAKLWRRAKVVLDGGQESDVEIEHICDLLIEDRHCYFQIALQLVTCP